MTWLQESRPQKGFSGENAGVFGMYVCDRAYRWTTGRYVAQGSPASAAIFVSLLILNEATVLDVSQKVLGFSFIQIALT